MYGRHSISLGAFCVALGSVPASAETWPDATETARRASSLKSAQERVQKKGAKGWCAGMTPDEFKTRLNAKPARLLMHHLYVGEGLSAIIRTPSGKIILYDGGVSGAGEDVIFPTLRDCYGATKVDYVVLSHTHDDHYGGLSKFIYLWDATAGNTIGKFFYPTLGVDGTRKLFDDVLAAAGPRASVPDLGKSVFELDKKLDSGLEINVVAVDGYVGATKTTRVAELYNKSGKRKDSSGKEVATGKSFAEDPLQDETLKDANASSIALAITYKKFTYYIAGDVTSAREGLPVEEAIATYLESTGFKADVVVSSHHGSSTANSATMLDALDPQVVVVSTGFCKPGRDESKTKTCMGGSNGTGDGGGYHLPDKPAIDRMLCMDAARKNCNVDSIFMTSPGNGKTQVKRADGKDSWVDVATTGFTPSDPVKWPAYASKVLASVRGASIAELAADPNILTNNPDFGGGGDVFVETTGTSYAVAWGGQQKPTGWTKTGHGRTRPAGKAALAKYLESLKSITK